MVTDAPKGLHCSSVMAIGGDYSLDKFHDFGKYESVTHPIMQTYSPGLKNTGILC